MGVFTLLWSCTKRISGPSPRSPFGLFHFRLLKTGSCGCASSRPPRTRDKLHPEKKLNQNSPSSPLVHALHHLTLSIISLGSGRAFIFITAQSTEYSLGAFISTMIRGSHTNNTPIAQCFQPRPSTIITSNTFH